MFFISKPVELTWRKTLWSHKTSNRKTVSSVQQDGSVKNFPKLINGGGGVLIRSGGLEKNQKINKRGGHLFGTWE